MSKTKNCELCRHAEGIGDDDLGGEKLACSKGHKPRFYRPTVGIGMYHTDDDYGWKRRCDDYGPERDRTVYIGGGIGK